MSKKSQRILLLGLGLVALVFVVLGYVTAESTFVFTGLFLSFFIVFVSLGIAIGQAAQDKGRSFQVFFLLSLLLSPVVMGIIVASVSPLPGSKKYQPHQFQAADSNNSTDSLTDEIERLGELKAKGLISQEEFDAKKTELLKRI